MDTPPILPPILPDSHIRPINIEDEMSSSYIDYSMSVIVGRALPDVRDGLKPVHRRCLFAMKELGNGHNKPYKKSARVVGDVIGKYHPHGDQSVYDTIVRLAQDFAMRYRLVDGQGNFGSVDGDPPAAMRYTEVRMDRLAEEMLADIDKETVPFGPNYDETLEQPLVLPSRLPNLLLNGSTGIAVGMATNIPPHNLSELCDAVTLLIDKPDCTISELMEHVHGPDFPTGAMICGTRQIEAMYKLGRGQLRVRGRAEIGENKDGRETILITELPYAVNKANMIAHIAHLVGEKVLEGISDLRDESSSKGIRVVVELKRGAIGSIVLNNLYKHTQLQTTFGANMLAIVDGRPRVLTLKQFLRCFVDHRFEVITKRTQFDLRKAEERRHILEGLRIALDNLDTVVRIIRESRNRDEARERLIASLGLSERQTNAILEMRLYQLTGLERDRIEDEYNKLLETIAYLQGLLDHPERIYGLIKEDMTELKQRYGDARRTEIVPMEGEVNIEDLIADAGCVVTLSHQGYIKRVPLATYREQRRGGRGIKGAATKEEDFVESLFICTTHDTLLFYTSDGRMYASKAYEIPEADRTSRGKSIANLLELRENEKIAAFIKSRAFREDQFVVMATERGVIKKTCLAGYRNVRRSGIIAINIDEGDRLIGVRLTGGDNEVMLVTANGLSIRFHESDLRDLGRAARGVRGILLGEDDRVVSLTTVQVEDTMLVCCEHGYGKRTGFDLYRRQSRGGKGVRTITTSARNGRVVFADAVHDGDALMLITSRGILIRTAVDQIRETGRIAQGVRLINLDDADTLVSASVVKPADDVEDPRDLEGVGVGAAAATAGGEQPGPVSPDPADGSDPGPAEDAAPPPDAQG